MRAPDTNQITLLLVLADLLGCKFLLSKLAASIKSKLSPRNQVSNFPIAWEEKNVNFYGLQIGDRR
jgi:hypothetical protein